MEAVPEDVVDGNDVLVFGVLVVTDSGGTRLDPDVAAMFVQQAVVLRQHLTFCQHCNTHIKSGYIYLWSILQIYIRCER